MSSNVKNSIVGSGALSTNFLRRFLYKLKPIIPHCILILFVCSALWPVLLVTINTFKTRIAIFQGPIAFPTSETFSIEGFRAVFGRTSFELYFVNTFVVAMGAILLILLTGSMVAWALSEYKFIGNTQFTLYFMIGIMIPLRIGTIPLLRFFVALGLTDSLFALMIIYTAQGLPLTILLTRQFMQQIPRDLKDAARIDGANEYRIYLIILPLVRPVLATVAIFTMLPIWNDLWWPLIFISSERKRTIILGTQQFVGQYVTDWSAVFAALFLATIPVVIFFVIFSRQLISGVTSGSLKQ